MQDLIDAITDIVMQRLAQGALPEQPFSASKKKSVTLLLDRLSPAQEQFIEQLRKLSSSVAFTIYASDDFPKELAATISHAAAASVNTVLSNYGDRIATSEMVLIAGLSLSLASKIALLIDDDNLSKLVFRAFLEGKAVFYFSEEFNLINSRSSVLPKRFYAEYRSRVESIASMGIKQLQIADLASAISGTQERSLTTQTAGNLITAEDLVTLTAGKKSLTVRAGTIVTPLAYQYAAEQGIEIIFK